MKYRDYMREYGSDYAVIKVARQAAADRAIDSLIAEKSGSRIVGASRYLVCPDGSVYSIGLGRLVQLRPGVKPGGYEFVGMTMDDGTRKYHMVHRLVASAFLPNPANLPEVNHRDGAKRNNVVGNLEWCDRVTNTRHMMQLHGIVSGSAHFQSKLTPEQVREIRVLNGRYRDIGSVYGVSAQTVCNVKRRSKYGDVQ